MLSWRWPARRNEPCWRVYTVLFPCWQMNSLLDYSYGKSTCFTGIIVQERECVIAMLNYQRVHHTSPSIFIPFNSMFVPFIYIYIYIYGLCMYMYIRNIYINMLVCVSIYFGDFPTMPWLEAARTFFPGLRGAGSAKPKLKRRASARWLHWRGNWEVFGRFW